MKLYAPSGNYKLEKIIFASRLLNYKLQHIAVPFDHKNKVFNAQYPNSTLPALELEDGTFVFGANSILLYLFDQQLQQLSPFRQAQVYQWLQFVQKDLQNNTGAVIVFQNKLSDLSQQQLNRSRQALQKSIKILQQRLKLRTYLVGDSLTAADVSIYFNLVQVKQFMSKQCKNLSSLNRWMANVESIIKAVQCN